MIDFILTVLASALGFLISTYIHGFIFSHFKADKYEDVLADNIAKRIVAREYAKRINSELRTYDGKL
jgi:hypothetical protein